MKYNPKPMDTSKVNLPKDILQLQENLAENIHETWAFQRFSQGWSYGPKRNDEKKEHPNLIPYYNLSEQDKDYDRKTAMETLKIIYTMGYVIQKN